MDPLDPFGSAKLAAQVLFYPVTDASFDTPSYHEFGEGYFLRRDGMQWFWDQYTTDHDARNEITASPLRATPQPARRSAEGARDHGRGGRPARRGRGLGRKLREAGVDVTATRYEGVIHDFVMLNALRGTNAAEAAISQAIGYLKRALGTDA